MAQKVRIARVDTATLQPANQSGNPIWDQHAAIISFIRRYLPASSASIIAEPNRLSASSFVDWYSDISGQPTPFSALDRAEKARVGKLLADRLQGLRDLAARHPGDPAATLLATAAVTPPEDGIYVISGQPVIVGWGRQGSSTGLLPPRPAAAIPTAAPAIAAAATTTAATAGARRGFPWVLAGLLAAALLLAALLWWLWPLSMPGTIGGDDRLAALQAEEAVLAADIAAAEAELRRRLAACTIGQTAPEPPKDTAEPPPPKVETPPVKAEPPPVPPIKAEPPPAAKPAPPKEAKPAPPVDKPSPPPAKPPHAMAEPPAPPPTCPPPRKKWEAPELVVLLDSSGSMQLKAGVSQEEVTNLVRRARAGDRAALAQLTAMQSGHGTDRLSAAKSAVNRMLSWLPMDMDVGLVVFGHCQGADNHKFFGPSERGRLTALLESITPQQGTPLARGIERAGNVVDGRNVPATLVVVTDGEDSCGGDPCAAARALKAAKPKVTINVVDVNGLGEGRCMAEATGGRVLPMKSADELPELIRRASGEAPPPPGCGG